MDLVLVHQLAKVLSTGNFTPSVVTIIAEL